MTKTQSGCFFGTRCSFAMRPNNDSHLSVLCAFFTGYVRTELRECTEMCIEISTV